MKIGITGASGQLGQLVVQKLKSMGSQDNLVALVRTPSKTASLGIESRQADYSDPATLKDALNGVNTLLLISSNEIGQRIEQHQNVIDAAKAAGVKRIVYTSLLHADVSPLSLAEEHLATEKALQASGIDYTILRNGWYTENYTASMPHILAGGAVYGSAQNGRISVASRADYADAAAVVLRNSGHAGKIYELAGDKAITLTELAEEISKQSGRSIPYQDLPESDYAKLLLKAGLPQVFANGLASWDACAAKNALLDDSQVLSGLIGRKTTDIQIAVTEALQLSKV